MADPSTNDASGHRRSHPWTVAFTGAESRSRRPIQLEVCVKLLPSESLPCICSGGSDLCEIRGASLGEGNLCIQPRETGADVKQKNSRLIQGLLSLRDWINLRRIYGKICFLRKFL